jgi:hypothetical protein
MSHRSQFSGTKRTRDVSDDIEEILHTESRVKLVRPYRITLTAIHLTVCARPKSVHLIIRLLIIRLLHSCYIVRATIRQLTTTVRSLLQKVRDPTCYGNGQTRYVYESRAY